MHYDENVIYSKAEYNNLICSNCIFRKKDLMISGTVIDGARNNNCRIYKDGKPESVFKTNKCKNFLNDRSK